MTLPLVSLAPGGVYTLGLLGLDVDEAECEECFNDAGVRACGSCGCVHCGATAWHRFSRVSGDVSDARCRADAHVKCDGYAAGYSCPNLVHRACTAFHPWKLQLVRTGGGGGAAAPRRGGKADAVAASSSSGVSDIASWDSPRNGWAGLDARYCRDVDDRLEADDPCSSSSGGGGSGAAAVSSGGAAGVDRKKGGASSAASSAAAAAAAASSTDGVGAKPVGRCMSLAEWEFATSSPDAEHVKFFCGACYDNSGSFKPDKDVGVAKAKRVQSLSHNAKGAKGGGASNAAVREGRWPQCEKRC